MVCIFSTTLGLLQKWFHRFSNHFLGQPCYLRTVRPMAGTESRLPGDLPVDAGPQHDPLAQQQGRHAHLLPDPVGGDPPGGARDCGARKTFLDSQC
jgi:hypothetical protein